MANSGMPMMPLAASSNMTMSMSNASAVSQETKDIETIQKAPEQDTTKETRTKSDSTQHNYSQHGITSSQTQVVMQNRTKAEAQHDRVSKREKTLSMQRIQLAEQLSTERKERESRVMALEDQISSLKYKNEALEAECQRLHGQLDEATRREKALAEGVGELESKLDGAVMTCDQQASEIKRLEDELKTSQTKLSDLQKTYDTLQEKHSDDANEQHKQLMYVENLEMELEASKCAWREATAKLASANIDIDTINTSYRSLEHDLEQKAIQTEKLEQKVNTLQTTSADAAEKHETTERELRDQVEAFRAQAENNEVELAESRSQAMEESESLQKLRADFDKLQRLHGPFPQTVIICVDLSGSVQPSINDIKQACRDVVHTIRSYNSDARVVIMAHGGYCQDNAHDIQTISEGTFRIVDDFQGGGTEDYTHCLKQANNLLATSARGSKLIVLIGDGNANNSDHSVLLETCSELKSSQIPAHSIIIHNESKYFFMTEFKMQDISKLTNGRVEYESTYLTALDEILRNEREQHFKGTQQL